MMSDDFDSYLTKIETGGEDKSIETLNFKRHRLAEASLKLKKDFIGLDSIIDRLIKNIEPWYVMPSSLRRPHIVCLWGMTGVGKTDLIRKMVQYLDFSDRYLEIQMSNEGAADTGQGFTRSIKARIEISNIETDTPGVLFLDEIQRYRTKDASGEANQSQRDQDIWQLLSDGRFAASTRKAELLEILYSKYMWDDTLSESDQDFDGEVKKPPPDSPYKRGYYTAKRLKKLLKLNDSVKDIMKWSDEHQEVMIRKTLDDPAIFAGDNYSKLLIIISGNIDEAYGMASDVSEKDIDADILHNISKNINFLDIKSSLLKRFYPEQIARFGNNHIIYPSLRKVDYYNVIRKTFKEISEEVFRQHRIEISFLPMVEELIYKNGVFPTQGVRPVFSTISSSVEAAIPKIIIYCIENSIGQVALDYDFEEKSFKVYDPLGREIISDPYEGDVDLIKKGATSDFRVKVAVHEVGHAIVYASLFEIAPTQIEGNVSGNFGAGFIGMHSIESNPFFLTKKIAVLLAGFTAEDIIFGQHSNGCSSDLIEATQLANSMVKRWAMGDGIGVRITPDHHPDEPLASSPRDYEKDAFLVEQTLNLARQKARDSLKKHRELFIRCVDILIEEESIAPLRFKEVCQEYGLMIDVVADDEYISPSYSKIFKEFKDKLALEALCPKVQK